MNFQTYINTLPQAIANQALATASDRYQSGTKEFEKHCLLIVLSNFDSEIGFELWWTGNQIYATYQVKKFKSQFDLPTKVRTYA